MKNTNNQWEQEFEEFWNKLYHGDSWHTEGQEKAETRRFITTLLEQQREADARIASYYNDLPDMVGDKIAKAIRSANHD